MIADLHNDYLLEIKSDLKLKKYLKENEKYLSSICSPIWTTELKSPVDVLESKIKLINSLSLNYEVNICIEDLGFLPKNDFDILKKIKPFYCGICWNNSNKFCGGAYSNDKFTQKGKNLVKFLEENNIIADTAHMNIYSFNNFVNITSKPILCSHTGFCEIIKDSRNLEESQIKTIIDSKGLVGLYFVGKYIASQKVKIEDIVKNIDYFVNKFGVKNIAIGSDFYGTKDLPYNLKNYKDFEKIKQKLQKLGYKNKELEQIFETNYVEFKKRAY